MNCPEFDLSDRVAIVTGATGFLGAEHCDALAESGARLVLVDVNGELCEERAARLIENRGADALGLGVDISQKAAVESMVESVVDHFGRIDILINNAQVQVPSMFVPFEDLSIEDWNRILDVNLTGAFLCCQAAGRVFVRQGSGSVINMGSIYGMLGPHHSIYKGTAFNTPAAYSVTKAGIYGLTRYLATYWAEKGIRVNAITPGGIYNQHKDPFHSAYSEQVPMKRMGKRFELRGAVKFLASDAASYVTGQNLVVDGGWTAW
jgi:NAD(P)-dependent dehydrogenase (short-subunit alcohol dehydrogenase family)